MHSALPARLLVDDTHAYILMDCEGGNLVSAPTHILRSILHVSLCEIEPWSYRGTPGVRDFRELLGICPQHERNTEHRLIWISSHLEKITYFVHQEDILKSSTKLK